MYSCVYLFLKVVEKKIFLKKKVMECIVEYTLPTLTTLCESVKKWPPCCGGQTNPWLILN